MSAAFVRPPGARRSLLLLIATMVSAARVELEARRLPLGELCRRHGVELVGFSPGAAPVRPLPRDVAHQLWAVEATLRWWPFARDRLCLRRSLIIGSRIRELSPALCIDVVAASPFRAHAWLAVLGQRLDMGETSVRLSTDGAGSS